MRYTKCGHLLKIRLKDHPVTQFNDAAIMRACYSCDAMPKSEMIKKNEQPWCITTEIRRKPLARKRQRSNYESPRKKWKESNHNKLTTDDN